MRHLMHARTRITVGALSGALALSALAAPLADAAPAATDVKNIVVNKGKPVVIGVSGSVTVPVTMSVTGGASHGASATLYHGRWPDATDVWVDPAKTCGAHAADYTCSMQFTFTARKTVKKNAQAGAGASPPTRWATRTRSGSCPVSSPWSAPPGSRPTRRRSR